MKTLCLLRHAHALPGVDDYERVLSAAGVGEAVNVGRFMKDAGLLPDAAAASAAIRTAQTARHVLESFPGVSARLERELYGASQETLLAAVQGAPAAASVFLLVGHNPAVANLAMTLAGPVDYERLMGYAPATLSVFTLEDGGWKAFAQGEVRLATVFVPGAAA